MNTVVCIHEHQISASRLFDSVVARGGHSLIFFVNHPDPAVSFCISVADVLTAVRRAVVNQNDFHLPPALGTQGIQTLGQIRVYIIHGDNDADQFLIFFFH